MGRRSVEKTSSSRKFTRTQREIMFNRVPERIRCVMLTSSLVLGVVGIVICGYGHAAISRDLLISGEAKIAKTGDAFGGGVMQEFTAEMCDAIEMGETGRLTDARDSQQYWVSKVGSRCVMSQDLRLTLSTEGLDSRLSDINYSATAGYEEETGADGEVIYKWNENSTYPPRNTQYNVNTGTSRTTSRSADLGEYVLKQKPTNNSSCGSNKTSLSQCPNQVVYVGAVYEENTETGEQEMVQPAYSQDWSYAETGKTYSEANRSYDSHYLLGIYYQYMTATAGSFVEKVNTRAPSSICPRGWRMALYAELNTANTEMAKVNGAAYFTEAPFYAGRQGYISNTKLTYVGYQGYRWAPMTGSISTRKMFGLTIFTGAVAVTGPGDGSDNGYFALNVRCILREEGE